MDTPIEPEKLDKYEAACKAATNIDAEFKSIREMGFRLVPCMRNPSNPNDKQPLMKWGGNGDISDEAKAAIDRKLEGGGWYEAMLFGHDIVILDFDIKTSVMKDRCDEYTRRLKETPEDKLLIYKLTSEWSFGTHDIISHLMLTALEGHNVNATITPSGGFHLIFRTHDKAKLFDTMDTVDFGEHEWLSNKIEMKSGVHAPYSLYRPSNGNIRKLFLTGRRYDKFEDWFKKDELAFIEDTPFVKAKERPTTRLDIAEYDNDWSFTTPHTIRVGPGRPIAWSLEQAIQMLSFIRLDWDKASTFQTGMPVLNSLTVLSDACRSAEFDKAIREWIKQQPKGEHLWQYYNTKYFGSDKLKPLLLLLHCIKNGWQRQTHTEDLVEYAQRMNVALNSKEAMTFPELLVSLRDNIRPYADKAKFMTQVRRSLLDSLAYIKSNKEWLVKSEMSNEVGYIIYTDKELRQELALYSLNLRVSTPSEKTVATEEMIDDWEKQQKKAFTDKALEKEKAFIAKKIGGGGYVEHVPLLDLFADIENIPRYNVAVESFRAGYRGCWSGGQGIELNTYSEYKPIWREPADTAVLERYVRNIFFICGPDVPMREGEKNKYILRTPIAELMKDPRFATAQMAIHWQSQVARGKKTGKAIILEGMARGIGKGKMTSMFCAVMNDRSANIGKNLEKVLDKNKVFKRANFVVLSEMSEKVMSDTRIIETLKDYITDGEFTMNAMGKEVDPKQWTACNILACTNHPGLIKYELDERRWVPIHVPDLSQGERQAYWIEAMQVYTGETLDGETAMLKHGEMLDMDIRNRGGARAIYEWLMTLPDLPMRETERVKEARKSDVISRMPVIFQFMAYKLNREQQDRATAEMNKHGKRPDQCSEASKALYDQFKEWYKDNIDGETKFLPTIASFGKLIRQIQSIEMRRVGHDNITTYSWSWNTIETFLKKFGLLTESAPDPRAK